MLWPIMEHVASLAEGREFGIGIVGGVVIPMGSSEDDPGSTGASQDVSPRSDPDPPSPPVAPSSGIRVPPASVAEVIDNPPVWPSAVLAAALGSTEADQSRELRPVDRVEQAVLGPDWHRGA